MERSPVNYDAPPLAQPRASAHTSSWPGAASASELPTFAAHMADVLGEDAAPDPLFLVETWTFGVDTATHNFQARHNTARNHNVEAPGSRPGTFRPFDFFVPLTFVEALPSDQAGFRSMPTAFPSAWKDAYGVTASNSSPQPAAAYGDLPPFSAPTPGEPLTAELACRTLGVAPSSTRKQIKAAYRHLVLRYHPDRFELSSEHDQRIATDRMTAINAAYHLLCDTAPDNI